MPSTVSVDAPHLEVPPDPHVSPDWPADLHRCEAAAPNPQPDTPSQPRRSVVHLAFPNTSATPGCPNLSKPPMQPRRGDTASTQPGPQPWALGPRQRHACTNGVVQDRGTLLVIQMHCRACSLLFLRSTHPGFAEPYCQRRHRHLTTLGTIFEADVVLLTGQYVKACTASVAPTADGGQADRELHAHRWR